MLRADAIRSLIRDHGPNGYLKIQARMLGLNENGSVPRGRDGKGKLHESVHLENGRKILTKRPSEFSIRALWEGINGPVEETLEVGADRLGFVDTTSALTEAVSSGLFPTAVGQLIATMVIEGYEEEQGYIADELVSPMDSQLKGERIVGFTSLQGPKTVVEGEAYEDSTFSDKFVTPRETKRGRLLSITREAVVHDQTGMILDRASQLGFYARQERERRIVRGVIDADSAERVYAPGGVGEQLYSSGNNNLADTNIPLVDWTDLQEVRLYHATNVTDDRQAEEEFGQLQITWNPRILLTGVELAGVAARIVGATQFGFATDDTISRNPVETLFPNLKPLSSAFIDNATDGDQWDDGSDWLFGDFKRQFREKIVWPLQTERAPQGTTEMWHRDILAQYKTSSYTDLYAQDERYVVKINAVA